MTHHPDLAALHDHVDGQLDAPGAEALERHLRDCADCARRVADIRALLGRASAAPRAVEPARDLWPGIRARLASAPVVPLRPGHATDVGRALPPLARRRLALLAAGLAIAVASSALTAVVLRRPPTRVDAPGLATGATPPATASPAATPPAAAPPAPRLDPRALDAEYARAAAELAATWRTAVAPRVPATAAAVDSSLHAVDGAIAELRRAAAAAPDDPLVAELLAAAWRRKIDLLRRALALPASA